MENSRTQDRYKNRVREIVRIVPGPRELKGKMQESVAGKFNDYLVYAYICGFLKSKFANFLSMSK